MKRSRRMLLPAAWLLAPAIWAQNPPIITAVVNGAGGAPVIAPNTWVQINGQNLTKGGDARQWQGADFVNSQMPTSLDGVSVTVNGVNAYVEYISPVQINILTPPNALPASVNVVVTKNPQISLPFAVEAQPISPAFFLFNGGPYVAARHADFSVLAPADLFPGISTPSGPDETILLYGTGFGQTSMPVTPGALVQGGTLATLPVIHIGGKLAVVTFAGLTYPGELQINVQLPKDLPSGDNPIVATYGGAEAAPVAMLRVQGSASPPATVTFYASPGGNDFWSGSLPVPNAEATDGPVASFDRARVLAQTESRAGLSQINVQFRGGTYSLAAPVMFTAADSGSATLPIVYQNFSGETPLFSGGMRVQNWTNVSGNKWQAKLPAGTQMFENLFYNGARRLRPRLGDGALGTFFRIVGPGTSATATDTCSVQMSNGMYECFDRFYYDSNAPIVSNWQNLAPQPNNPCGAAAGNPALAGDIELLVFEQFTTSKLRINCVDSANRLIYLTGTTPMPQANASQVGFIPTNRYLLENVRDALTQPGQWFLDHSTTPWTLTYLSNPGENPNNDTVMVPQVGQLLVASGLQYVTFRGLTFEHDNYVIPPGGHPSSQMEPDITAAVSFQNSQHITFDSGTVTQTSGTGLEFISCLNNQSPAYCVANDPNGANANNTVENSAIYDIGVLGLRIGGPYISAYTDSNSAEFMLVQNNVVSGYGRVIPAAFGIGQGSGHDNVYTHNDVYDGYHCAISISSLGGDTIKPNGVGNANNTISFNHVYSLLQGIMNDGGAIRIAGGNQVYTAPGNKILNNRIHDVTDAGIQDGNGYGGDGIYLDNQTGLVDVEDNLVYRVSANAVFTPQGPSLPNEANIVKNNILAFSQLALVAVNSPYPYGVPAQANQVFVVSNNLFYFDRTSNSSPKFFVQGGCVYSAGFPYTQFQQWSSNLYWRTDGTFATDAKAFLTQPNPTSNNGNAPCASGFGNDKFYTFAQWQQQLNEDLGSVIQNPGFKNPAYPTDDFSLPLGSPGAGFVAFDMTSAGRSHPVLNPPAIQATFPTRVYNPAMDY